MKKILGLSLMALFCLQACTNNSKQPTEETTTEVKLLSPEFNADSAFAYTKAQVDFGPRIPSTTHMPIVLLIWLNSLKLLVAT